MHMKDIKSLSVDEIIDILGEETPDESYQDKVLREAVMRLLKK